MFILSSILRKTLSLHLVSNRKKIEEQVKVRASTLLTGMKKTKEVKLL